jgi:parallel beta-helix repeat protein
VKRGRLLRLAGSLGGSVLLLAGSLSVASGVAASSTTWYVSPTGASGAAGTSCATASFGTISAAVSAAAAGDTVIVCAGTYKEDVAVTKALTLSGQGATIDATGLDNGVKITASNVTVTGFTVENATGEGILAQQPNPVKGPNVGGTQLYTGVPISHVTITRDTVQNNDLGGLTPTTTTYTECQASGNIPGDCGEGIHLWSVANSSVTLNTVTGNAGGILLTDEFGPTHDNLIAGNVVTDNAYDCGITLPSHSLGRDPTTGKLMPAFGGVYDNILRNNILLDNGIKGQGAGIGIFAPGPGTASYGNLIEGNTISGNGLAGVALHAHAPGAYVGGNTISGYLIGPNNLDGDTDVSPTADNATTGILAWSAATPITVTISGNTIFGNWYGIWLGHVVSAPGASARNTFWSTSTRVHKA